MKIKVVASSVILALTFSGLSLAEEKADSKKTELKAKLSALENEYSKAELLTALNTEPKEGSKFHGTIGSVLEVERYIREANGSNGKISEGKVKFSPMNGNFRHEDLPGVDFGFYMAREDLFTGNTKHADYNRGVNDIHEVYFNKSYGIENGSLGWGLKYAQESIDKRTTPGVKIFGSYQITDWLDIHGYSLYQVEFKRGAGQFNYFEIEPGLGFKIADNMGAWLNLRFQTGTWDAKGPADKETEVETIIKPGLWYSFGKLGTAMFAEIGKFEKENDRTGAHLWGEDYIKIGMSANYPIAKNWRLFGEVSYKSVDVEFTDHSKSDAYLPFGLVGVNYSF